MIVESVVVGSYQANCYILSIGNDCLVIDPGDEYDKIKKLINKRNVQGILITHRHFDHIGALNNLLNDYSVKVYEYANLEEKEYKIGNFTFDVLYTKGHTSDSVTYYFKDEKVMFTGDFLFLNSIGRTDLPTGNYEEMLESIERIKKYADDIVIYPGHGNITEIGLEKTNNFWFDKINY